MRVHDAMTTSILSVDRDDSVEGAARRMVERWVGSAMVNLDPPGIITERDVLTLVGSTKDPRTARVADHCTVEAICAAPEWSLERAAEAMTAGGFRHLVVAEGDQTVGILSIRDIVASWAKGRRRSIGIQIREAMNRDPCIVGRDEALDRVARHMVDRAMGAAIVNPPESKSRPGIITDRDVLELVASGQNPGTKRVGDHLSRKLTFSAPDWSLKQAAEAMIKGGFQHVVVVDARETLGVIAMSDIVRCWLD
ncbi:hypothetical protein BH24ACT26_BH24ACT26_06040 [soil metagenome]